jgi:hypothetical protein
MQKYEKEKKLIFGHMKVQEKKKNRDTWRSQGIGKKRWAHEGSYIYKKMIAMSQNK